MKKLLVLALAVVLILSFTVVASAAALDAYVGGRITWAYINSDSDDDAVKEEKVTHKNSGLKMLLRGKISDEETGTWGTIGAQINHWSGDNNASVANNFMDFGVKNIAGSDWSIWYTNWENENMKRGQDRIRGLDYAQYHRDPMFDHAMGEVLGFDYNTDKVVVNIGYAPEKAVNKTLKAAIKTLVDANDAIIKANADPVAVAAAIADNADLKASDASYDTTYGKNAMQIAATFKFDGGDVHAGYFFAGDNESKETILGANYKLGFGTIKADYLQLSPKTGDSVSQIQAAVFFDELKFDVTLLMDDKYTFATDGGMGYQIRYTGFDKVTIGYAALAAEDEADEGSNMTDMYIGYKYGVLETRLGAGTKGEGDAQEKITYVSAYASFW